MWQAARMITGQRKLLELAEEFSAKAGRPIANRPQVSNLRHMEDCAGLQKKVEKTAFDVLAPVCYTWEDFGRSRHSDLARVSNLFSYYGCSLSAIERGRIVGKSTSDTIRPQIHQRNWEVPTPKGGLGAGQFLSRFHTSAPVPNAPRFFVQIRRPAGEPISGSQNAGQSRAWLQCPHHRAVRSPAPGG